MHRVKIRQEIIHRVIKRRGQFHLFDSLEPTKTAFLVIDMQNMFCEPNAPAEVPLSRKICTNINRLCNELRELNGLIVWITSASVYANGKSDWEIFRKYFISETIGKKTMEYMKPDGHGEQIWHELDVKDEDLRLRKNRYSPFTPGSSTLQRVLSSHGITNILIGGTKTNICCESTARDAMMLDFKTVVIEDCCAALSDAEHQSTLENVIQQFGDVMTADEITKVLTNR